MSIDERLRAGLVANTDHLDGDLERELATVFRRVHRRRQARVVGATLLATAVAAALVWFVGVPGLDLGARHQDPIKRPKVIGLQPRSMEGVNGPLEAGVWIVPLVGQDPHSLPRAVVEVPAGYGSPGGWVVDRGADGDPENHGDVAFWTAAAVVDDPCEGVTATDPGPTVRNLADALVAQPGTRTTTPRTVTVDGRHGLYLEVTLPGQDRLNSCHNSGYTLWHTNSVDSYTGSIGGTVNRFWILDVDGTRVVMVADTTPGEDAADIAEIVAIATSAHFIDPLEPLP